MSLAIVVKVPEGLVLAAESRVSYDIPNGDEGKRLVTFDNATKLLSFGKYKNFGAVTFGVANIGDRTAHSFLPEFLAYLKKEKVGLSVNVETFSKKMSEFYLSEWKSAMPEDFADGEMIFVTSGFESGSVHGRVYQFSIPSSPEPTEVPNMQTFNSVWGGQNELVSRVVLGHDPKLISWVKENIESTPQREQEFAELISQLELPIVYGALALQDAINLAKTFIRMTIDIQSLTANLRGVGGPTDVAIITKELGFKYIQRKTLTGGSEMEQVLGNNVTNRIPLGSATPRDWRHTEQVETGKKRFKELIKRASQPVPKGTGKLPRSGDYTEKKTRPSKAVDTSVKQRGKSPAKNASTETKSPR